MFPLTDLSILFTALLIIAFAFLGIFVLFGLFICKRYQIKQERPIENPAQTSQIGQGSDIGEKIDKLNKESRFGTMIALSGLGLTITIYSITTFPQYPIRLLVGVILGVFLALIGWDSVRKIIEAHPKEARRAIAGIVSFLIVLSILGAIYNL